MTGHIQRRMTAKQMQTNTEFAASMRSAKDDVRREVLARRELRSPPSGDHETLIEYFLSTNSDDMDFEIARCRPLVTDVFFKDLDTILGRTRFSSKPDEEKIAELEALRQYLSEAIVVIDNAVTNTASAVDRMKKLLTSRDKKATILEMAEANEIDQALVELLQQNIVAARNAEQEDAAKFMEKVLVATSRHFISVQQTSTTMPEKSAALNLQQAAPLMPAAAPTPGQSLLLNATAVPASSGAGKNSSKDNSRKTAGGLYLP
ncbi:MAG: hypothetical protein WDW38_005203 [Sanguina aurantia]